MDADRSDVGSTYGEADGTEGDYVYVMSFKIVNPAATQAAPKISIDVSDSFEAQVSPHTLNPDTQCLIEREHISIKHQYRMMTLNPEP